MTAPPLSHQTVIAGALDTWRLHSDPARPLDHTDAARQVEEHLLHHGYFIAPYALKAATMPTRRAIITVALLALVCSGSAIAAAIRDDWWWAAIGLIGTGLLTCEAARDISDRRHGRRAR